MQSANRYALKEWAVVCEALASGRQTLILRKGGIHEERDGFRVEHGEFWLFPTRFHQERGEIVPDAHPLLERAIAARPPEGTIRFQNYAVVSDVFHVTDEALLPSLAGLHILSEETVRRRFHYRTPGLFVLAVRIYRLPEPIEIAESPHFAGCRSWVELPGELPTAEVKAVLSDGQATKVFDDIRSKLASR